VLWRGLKWLLPDAPSRFFAGSTRMGSSARWSRFSGSLLRNVAAFALAVWGCAVRASRARCVGFASHHR